MKLENYNKATELLQRIDAFKSELERINNREFQDTEITFTETDGDNEDFTETLYLPEGLTPKIHLVIVDYYKNIILNLEKEFDNL